MRYALALCGVSLVLAGCVANQPIDQAELSYSAVVEVAGKSKDQLYVNANVWFVDTFNDPKSVIQYSDKDAGKIAGKYYSPETAGMVFYGVRQTVTVDVKDGKARISFKHPESLFEGSVLGGVRAPQQGFDWVPVYDADLVPVLQERWRVLEAAFTEAIGKTDDW